MGFARTLPILQDFLPCSAPDIPCYWRLTAAHILDLAREILRPCKSPCYLQGALSWWGARDPAFWQNQIEFMNENSAEANQDGKTATGGSIARLR